MSNNNNNNSNNSSSTAIDKLTATITGTSVVLVIDIMPFIEGVLLAVFLDLLETITDTHEYHYHHSQGANTNDNGDDDDLG